MTAPQKSAPIIAIVGSAKRDPEAQRAAESLGRELANAGFRILVYSSNPEYVEQAVVRGYLGSQAAAPESIEVRYPLRGDKPAFAEQATHPRAFSWRPDPRPDWEMSFYQSLQEANGAVFLGGGTSTKIAGLVAIGHGLALLPLAAFGGEAQKVWEAITPARDLPSPDEYALMGRPDWDDNRASACAQALVSQLARKSDLLRLKRLEERRREIDVTWRALVAALMFCLSVACVFFAWAFSVDALVALGLLLFAPLLAGISGSTSRLVFDLRQGSAPLSRESAITTAALGLIAGGAAALLFIIAQVTTSPAPAGEPGLILDTLQARKLAAFGILVGFTAGLTLDAVFRKLIASDVAEISVIEAKKKG